MNAFHEAAKNVAEDLIKSRGSYDNAPDLKKTI